MPSVYKFDIRFERITQCLRYICSTNELIDETKHSTAEFICGECRI